MVDYLLNQPILIALGIVVVVSIVLGLVLPLILRGFGTTKSQIFFHDSGKFFKGLRRHPVQTMVGFVLILGTLAVAYYLYAKDQPVTLSAASFVRQERAELDKIQGADTPAEGLEATDELVLIDIRGVDFYKAHIKGAYNIPIEIFRLENQPIGHKRVGIYSDNLKDAQEAANYLKKQKGLKIYIVKDGYEGLKSTGLTIQENYVQ